MNAPSSLRRVLSRSFVALLLAALAASCHDGGGPECSADMDCGDDEICNKAYDDARCLPPGTTGERCVDHDDCSLELRCYGEYQYHHEDQCLPPGVYGYPCQQDHNCAAGFRCSDGATKHCITEKDDGDFCTSDTQCVGGLSCIAGHCDESDVVSGD